MLSIERTGYATQLCCKWSGQNSEFIENGVQIKVETESFEDLVELKC